MKNIWHIGWSDLKMMVRDKVFFFWTLVFPLVFIMIFGNLFQGGGGAGVADLKVLNQDRGQWGAYFVEKLKSPTIALEVVETEPEEYIRLLVLPPDFSEKIQSKTAQELAFKTQSGSNQEAGKQAEIKIAQGMVKLITELILHPDTATFFESRKPFKDMVEIKTRFPENTLTKIPSGFDHVIPGIMVQFILMMVLIYGGISVMENRQKGILTRVLYGPVSIPQLWGGKFMARLMMGLVQAFILIVTGILFFKLNLGNPILSILNIVFFSLAIASLSIFIGSVLDKEDLIVGVSVMLANVFAALGGCWWPIEVVPESVRTIGMISPAYWAMDAFHKIIFFNRGFSDISLNFLVFLGFGAVFTVLAVKYFKIK